MFMMQAVFCSPSHCQGPVWGWEGGTTKQKPTSTLNFWYCCCFVLWLQTPWRNKMHQAVPKTHSLQTLGMIISASFSFQQQHMQQQLCSSALRPRVLWNPLENCDLHVKSRKIIFFSSFKIVLRLQRLKGLRKQLTSPTWIPFPL